jgi:hypothetical protein
MLFLKNLYKAYSCYLVAIRNGDRQIEKSI